MPKYRYKGKTSDGKDVEEVLEAKDRYELAKVMRRKGIIVTETKRIDEKTTPFLSKIMFALNSVKLKEKSLFANNLSAMLEAGLSLTRALEVLQKQADNPKLKATIEFLIEGVNQGKPLSISMEKFPKTFSPLFVSMVAAGEESGKLAESLLLVGDQLTKTYELKRKIRGAMIYPTIIIIVISIIGALMMIFLVPTLTDTFADLGGELPIQTQLLIGASDFMVANVLYIIVFVVLAVLFFSRFRKTKMGIKTFSLIFLHLPVIKNITKNSNSALMMRTLSSLVSSGVGVLESIEITQKVLQNYYFKESLKKAQSDVQKGLSLSYSIQQYENLYPVLVGEMLEVGEETGKLSEMLAKGAHFYEGEVDAVTSNLSTIIEPVLMVLIGVSVGFFALAVIQPLYSLGDLL